MTLYQFRFFKKLFGRIVFEIIFGIQFEFNLNIDYLDIILFNQVQLEKNLLVSLGHKFESHKEFIFQQ